LRTHPLPERGRPEEHEHRAQIRANAPPMLRVLVEPRQSPAAGVARVGGVVLVPALGADRREGTRSRPRFDKPGLVVAAPRAARRRDARTVPGLHVPEYTAPLAARAEKGGVRTPTRRPAGG